MCSFQSQSFVTAECWVFSAVTKSGYIGFDDGSLEELTFTNLGFEGNPHRQMIVWPSERSITHVAYSSGALLFTTRLRGIGDPGSQRIVFQIRGSSDTFEMSQLIEIWLKNKVVRKPVWSAWSDLHTAVFGPQNLEEDELTEDEELD
ncbi:hypothetical protein MVEN_00098400 [Mycena venus]|uniref:Uncharacterized protein n=1 Tax=Mycena venus TaxID=2733690 RepID=A0A8H6ZB00_9AGAR|nr:hypothetical protein MVEN_00098400 [Mycena venus]